MKTIARKFFSYVLPLLLWMAFIFPVWNRALGSSAVYSTFASVFHWLLPHASRAALDLSYIVFRKSLHFVEYGFLAFLFYRAFRAGRGPFWSTRTGLEAAAAAAAYGFLDEYLQSFVPNRFGSAFDWIIDTTGILTALALIAWSSRRRKEAPGPGSVPGGIVEYGLLGLLLWSPLPAASVEEWAVFVIELAAAAMAAAYVLTDPKPALNPHLPPVLKGLRPVALALFGFLALQVVPLPLGLVRLIAPGSYNFRRLYAPEFGRMKFTTLSIVPAETIGAALFLAALFILGYLVLRTVNRGRQIRTILAVLVGAGAFQALYGLFELTRSSPRLLFYKKVINLDSVTGTFVNRNHFCGYVEMIVPLALGLAIGRIMSARLETRGAREKLLAWTTRDMLVNILIFAAAAVMALAIVLSNSRSGLAVLAFSLFLFLELWFSSFTRTGFRRPWVGKTVRVGLVALTVVALSLSVGSTIRRFARDDLLRENRPQYWTTTLAMIREFPVFGTGLGTFAAAYDAYEKTSSTELRLVHAHNDYLEYAAELGLLGVVLLLGLVLYVALSAYLAWRERRSFQARALALGGLVSIAGIGLHAVTDFNLHIPANMVLFVVVLCLTPVMAFYQKS